MLLSAYEFLLIYGCFISGSVYHIMMFSFDVLCWRKILYVFLQSYALMMLFFEKFCMRIACATTSRLNHKTTGVLVCAVDGWVCV